MTKVKCLLCGDIIESNGRGKWVACSCGSCYVDETPYYCRIGGNFKDLEIIKEDQNDSDQNVEEQQRINQN